MQAELDDELAPTTHTPDASDDDMIFRIVHAKPSGYKRPTHAYDALGIRLQTQYFNTTHH
jgi:hypothetical protein